MADPANPLGRFDLPFAEQIDFFRQKLNLPTAKWDDIRHEQHDRAFVVAGAAKADLLDDLRQAVDLAITKGTTLATFRDSFRQIVFNRGWHGWTGEGSEAGFNWRTKVIYETNLRASYAAGREAQLADPGLQKLLPYRRYIHSDSVLHPRPLHLAWNGLTLPHDHEFWKTHSPPNGWNCFPAGVSVRCDARVGLKTWYAGKMVEIETAAGNRLSVTANHPVLTCRGWLPAHMIEQGEQLLRASGDIDAPLSGVVNHQKSPSSAEDLFEALATQGLRVIPMAPDDFHGDARLRKPEIHVAGADRALVDTIESAPHQFAGKRWLNRRLHRRVESAGVSRGAPLAATVFGDAVLAQNAADGWFGDAEAPGDQRLAEQPGAIERHDLALGVVVRGVSGSPGSLHDLISLPSFPNADPAIEHPCTTVANGDAVITQDAAERIAADAKLYRDLLEANAGLIATDEVVDVRKFDWSGHVYDFSTETGLIVAGGLVVSNCRCRVTAVAAPRKGDPTEPPAGWNKPGEDGTLPGIDKGWGYAPGASVRDELRALVEQKVAKLPAPLGKALAEDVDAVLRPAKTGAAEQP